jgi:hypothetical protein
MREIKLKLPLNQSFFKNLVAKSDLVHRDEMRSANVVCW